MKHTRLRIALVIIEVFVGLGAIGGGIALLTGAISVPLDGLKGSPFVDYTVPALVLMIGVGGSMLLAAVTIRTGHDIGVLASVLAGLVMMIFEIVEIAVLDRTGGSALVFAVALQVFYFALGVAILGLSSALWMTEFRSRRFPTQHVRHA